MSLVLLYNGAPFAASGTVSGSTTSSGTVTGTADGAAAGSTQRAWWIKAPRPAQRASGSVLGSAVTAGRARGSAGRSGGVVGLGATGGSTLGSKRTGGTSLARIVGVGSITAHTTRAGHLSHTTKAVAALRGAAAPSPIFTADDELLLLALI